VTLRTSKAPSLTAILDPAHHRDTKAATSAASRKVDRDRIVDHAAQPSRRHRPAIGAAIFVQPGVHLARQNVIFELGFFISGR
jgi:hypothetical protein